MKTGRLMGAVAVLLMAANWCVAEVNDASAVARQVDTLLAEEGFGGSTAEAGKPAPLADDQTFLRRATLDLIGHPPTAAEITVFGLDSNPAKRSAAVERLLADRRFGENWARYWRDVILYRRVEDRALLASGSAVEFLSEALNNDPHWDKIAREFITATGDVSEEGATALIMSQMAGAEDTTAEVSRIFLGIQIQCAQCHDHPTDRWKREQFHELAAFFPRVGVRVVKDGGKRRTWEIVGVDGGKGGKKPKKARGANLEHRMPDLNKPEDPGQLMQPVFFVTGQRLEEGMKDAERRSKVAEWITSREDGWFAKAFVNRMWSELVGHGFYEPVDDIGPDRDCAAPRTLDYLSNEFASGGYDVKWLFRAITATEAYQRESQSRFLETETPFAASCPQRLRGDQLFNALAEVLEFDAEAAPDRKGNYRAALSGPRGQMNETFGYDPSVRRDEVAGSIPQALLLMNGPVLNRAMSGAKPDTSLGKLLAGTDDNGAVVHELYLRSLGREPTEAEQTKCLEYVQGLGNRTEAFEDVLWALVNSTEFLNRK